MTPETREQERSHLGRRSLVRAGVWAVPVVGIAVAAPAIAASANVLAFYTASGYHPGDGNTHIQFLVGNNSGSAVGPIRLTVVLNSSQVSGVNPVIDTAGGFSFVSLVTGTGTLTYTFTAASIPAYGSVGTLLFHLPLINGAVSANVSASAAAPAIHTITASFVA